MSEYIKDCSKEKKIELILKNKKYITSINVAVALVTSGKVDHKISISFGGEGSYTNGNQINIGVFEFLPKYNEKTIMFSLIAAALHESEHVVKTDFSIFKRTEEAYGKETFEYQLVNEIFNCIEDGRIEFLHKREYINNIKYINVLRNIWWKEQPIEKFTLTSDIEKSIRKKVAEIVPIQREKSIFIDSEEVYKEYIEALKAKCLIGD